MTIQKHVQLDCPNCGATNRILVWDTINAQLNPEARTALLRGEINVLACERCGEISRIEKSLLYHDMENRFMVWYFPFSWVENGEIFDIVTPDGEPKGMEYFPEIDYASIIHYVFDTDELVRYVEFREVLAEKIPHTPG